MALVAERKSQLIDEYRQHQKDTGSPEVQIALLTAEVAELQVHIKANPKDKHTRRGLITMVNNRRRLQKYLARQDKAKYQALCQKLDLRS